MCNHCMKDGKVDESLADYYHNCPACGVRPGEDGECECAPEGYLPPGCESFLYVNAYEVTRHYGGPEEGGWYYNHHEPIASIPVKAVSKAGHSNGCFICESARRGEIHPVTGEAYELCKWSFELEATDPAQVETFKKYLEDLFADINEGSIYSVLGGSELHVVVEDHKGERTPRPHYE